MVKDIHLWILHHQLQINLWEIGNIPYAGTKPWVILGDLNELSSLDEKLSTNTGKSTRYNTFNNFTNNYNLIDLGFTSNPYIGHKKREKHGLPFLGQTVLWQSFMDQVIFVLLC